MPERAQRKLVLQMGVSLDVMVALPDGDGLTPVLGGQWGLPTEDPELTELKLAWLWDTGAHVMGRVTYTEMASFWPTSNHAYAAPMNEIPKVVFSDSLASADWGPATIARGDLAAAITRLKRERPDGYLLAQGGVRFARSLVQTGLIDEYRLVVHPVILGAGERLFTMPLTMEPVSTIAFSGGAVAHVFTAHP
jgi:dihydrofolate reductase